MAQVNKDQSPSDIDKADWAVVILFMTWYVGIALKKFLCDKVCQ